MSQDASTTQSPPSPVSLTREEKKAQQREVLREERAKERERVREERAKVKALEKAEKAAEREAKALKKAEEKASRPVELSATKEWTHKLRIVAKAFVGKGCYWMSSEMMPATRYDTLHDDRGARRMVQLNEMNHTLTAVADDAVQVEILKYTEQTLGGVMKDFATATIDDVIQTRKFIFHMAPSMSQDVVIPIATLSQKGYAYERLPYNLDSTAPCPTWDSILSRCGNAQAMRAFFGSLLDPHSDRSQFLYLYGSGNEGKGSMIEALSSAFGSAHTNQTTPKDARFWLSATYNKRLVTFSECDDFKWAVSEDMKAITGNDTVTIDEKYHAIFKARAICKFMFASNVKPSAQDTPAHRRRLIYSEIAPWSGDAIPVRTFVARLKEEMHAFLSECWRVYKEVCPTGGLIPVDKDAFDNLIDDNNSNFEEILGKYFILDKRLVCKIIDIESVFVNSKLNPNAKMAFVNFLKNSKGLKYNNRYVGDTLEHKVAVKGLWGIAPKPNILETRQYNQFLPHKEWLDLLTELDFTAIC